MVVKSASISFLIVMAVASSIEGSSILVSVPFGTKSHKNMYVPLVQELVTRGHNITVITNYMTADFMNLDNVREIVLEQLCLNMSHYPNVFDSLLSSSWNWGNWGLTSQLLRTQSEYPPKVTNVLYDNPKVQQMLAKDTFDLVIASQVLLMSSAPLAWHFKAPLIVFSPNTLFPGMATILGDDEHTSYVPLVFSPYTNMMNLWQRIINTLATNMILVFQQWYEGSIIPSIVKEKGMPCYAELDEIIRNVTVVLTNSHPSFSYPRSLPPQVIEVGGIHCRSPKPLPNNLENFVSGADGFLLFSIGSLQNMEDMPEYLLQSFIRIFSRLPLRVIWQWKGKIRSDLPANVLAIPWLPQQDLLGHPGCRAFITHGGLNSLQEAIYHGVPMLGIPFGIDQFLNLRRAVNDGYALQLQWKEINENTLNTAIQHLLFNKSFSDAAVRLSGLLRDQMETPLERAAFWTEYVIRHNGSVDHLRLGSRELAPYQRSLIDVYLLLILVGITPLVLVLLCFRNCSCSSKNKVTARDVKNKQE
ncbi:UDP-glycosyltransferase UGT4-like [Daphnia carinata]|uniref:UDP-glycosyltransferase UGT4-like n=1 Tax=Daphnia carinata TaxID=120202 RepID=UPI00257D361C|nr:UDP-glycosyltransferase UGT4-like [Daphnia carinata]